MSWNKEDRSFKTLINKETTDSSNKSFYNEFGADTVNVHIDDVWAEIIPFNDPTQAVAISRVEEKTLFVLTEDLTVPNSQSWKAEDPPGTPLKDWVSDKYGADFTVRLFDGSNNEIFTTDPLDWFFDYQTGILTFNNTLTKPTPLKITGYRYIGDKGVSRGNVTLGDMIIPIDYNDVNAVDPPAGLIFFNQDDVDNFLITQGATNFKHIEAVWDALPIWIRNTVTLSLAPGVHRPLPPGQTRSSTGAFTLTGKWVIPDKSLTFLEIKGPPPSQWLAQVASQVSPLTITGLDLGFTGDPWVDVSGTPFSGLDLRGAFAVFDTGLATTIHSHTNNRLSVLSPLLPTPSTVWVAIPSAILRNGQTDLSNDPGLSNILSINLGGATDSWGYLTNLTIQPLGGGGVHVDISDGHFILQSFLIDQLRPYNDFSITPNGSSFTARQGVNGLEWTEGGYVGPIGIVGNDWVYNIVDSNLCFLINLYFGGSQQFSALESCTVYFASVVHDALAEVIFTRAVSLFFNFGFGKLCEIRSPQGSKPGLRLVTSILKKPWLPGPLIFSGCVGSCLQIDDKSSIEDSPMFGIVNPRGIELVDGGGNLDVGVEFIGLSANFRAASTSDLTGSGGDVKMADGTLRTWAQVTTTPYSDPFLNVIVRET